MISFRLDNILYMQYDQMMQTLLDGWETENMYAIRENLIIFPLKNGQFSAYSLTENTLTKPQLDDDSLTAITEAMNSSANNRDYLLKDDSIVTEVCKFLLLLIRRVYELKPHADKHMTQVLLAKLNKKLEAYKLQIGLDRDEYIRPTFLIEDEIVSLEKAMEILRTDASTQVQTQTTQVVTKSIVQYVEVPTVVEIPAKVTEKAAYDLETEKKEEDLLQNSDDESMNLSVTEDVQKESVNVKDEVDANKEVTKETQAETSNQAASEPAKQEAIDQEKDDEQREDDKIPENVRKLFESALNGAKPGTEVYHSICFAMGEIMYYRDELESAIYFYEKCEIDRVEDKEDFYERLGHCYLDDKMDAFASSLKLIYRAEHNEAYRESHKEELEKVPHFSKTEIIAYREKCISLGEEMYRKKSES